MEEEEIQVELEPGERTEPSGKHPKYIYQRWKNKGVHIVTFKADKRLLTVIECLKLRLGLDNRSDVIRLAIMELAKREGCTT